jgi:hypothetical protein
VGPAAAPCYIGSWLGVTRARFADLSDQGTGYLVALEVKGWGVMLLSTADPALYLLVLETRLRPQLLAEGEAFDLLAIWGPVTAHHQLARELVEQFTGTKQTRLIREPLQKVVRAVCARRQPEGGAA